MPHTHRVRELIAAQIADAMARCCTAQSPWPLLLYGDAGTGKTCAALHLIDRAKCAVAYRVYSDLCESARAAMMGELFEHGSHGSYRVTVEDVWRGWDAAGLAVLDEIGTRNKVTDHQYEVLKRAIDKREGRPTVLISNLSPKRIAELCDDRIASRCCAGTVVWVDGDDMRQAK